MNRYPFTYFGSWGILLLFMWTQAILSGCDQVVKEDILPAGNGKIKLNPDQRTISLNQKLDMKDLLNNDTIPQAASFQVSTPRYGFLIPNTYRYVPEANFVGVDSLAYTVCIGDNCHSTYVQITVKDSVPPGAPCTAQANPDWVTIVRDSVVRYPVYLNDMVCDRFRVFSATQPVFGSIDVDEQMRVVYRPAPGFIGADSVWYLLQQGVQVTGNWFHVRVQPRANDPLPTYCTTQYAQADSLIASAQTDPLRQHIIQVLDNDVICDNVCSNLRVEVISQDGPGQAVVTLDGRAIRYTAPEVGGSVTRLRYRVCASCATQPVCLEAQVYIRNE